MHKQLIGITVVVVLIASLTALGCPPPREQVDPLGGTLVVGGSMTVKVVAVHLAERFMEKSPDIVVELHGVGSTAGIIGAHERIFDIAMASRRLTGAELEWGLREFVISYDGIAPIVHPDNPVRDLTMEQIRKIFLGEITDWREVGGKDMAITVVTREEGSGTRAAWEDIVHEDIYPHYTLIGKLPGGMGATVAGDPSAIGYTGIAFVHETVRALTVDGVEPTGEMLLAGKYPISRPFLFVTKGEPCPLEQKFIDFVLGPEGQQMLEDEGLVRVN